MSLKGELGNKDSWVTQFFRNELAELASFTRREGKAVKELTTTIPLDSQCNPQLVGTAFDYRVRLRSATNLLANSVLRIGILKMSGVGSGLGSTVDDTWANVTEKLLLEFPLGDDALLSRISVALAWLDWGFRSRVKWDEGMRAIAKSLSKKRAPAWTDYVASVDENVANEVDALFQAARSRIPNEGAIYGPEFAGSLAVGGADADLIANNCLYEFKTSVNPRRKFNDHIRQLIGYTLLDWENEYALEKIGFYYSRQVTCLTWPLSELLVECSGNKSVSLRSLRKRFRACAKDQDEF